MPIIVILGTLWMILFLFLFKFYFPAHSTELISHTFRHHKIVDLCLPTKVWTLKLVNHVHSPQPLRKSWSRYQSYGEKWKVKSYGVLFPKHEPFIFQRNFDI